jgi:hypothetical protein
MLQGWRENTDGLAVQVIQNSRQQQGYDKYRLGPEAEVRHRGVLTIQELYYPATSK